MNPLSPFTYYFRHKRLALMLIAFQALAVTGLYLLVGLMRESYIAPYYTMDRYLSKFSLVQPDQGNALDPAVSERIRANPDVDRIVPQINVEITVPNVGGMFFPFRLLGLQEADAPAVLKRSNVTLKEGQWLRPGTNDLMLSEEVAAALNLKIGDTIGRSTDEQYYAAIVSPLKLVGILSGDARLGIVSYEFLERDEGYRRLAAQGLLVLARPGREAAMDDFLTREVADPQTKTYGLRWLEGVASKVEENIILFFSPIVLLITIAVALVVNAINQIAFTRRLAEFGTLYAVGRGKDWLARRLALETAGLAFAGWTLGVGISLGAMTALSHAVYAPKGFPFDPVEWEAFALVAAVPLAVTGFTLWSVLRAFVRMDAIAIVERGELSMEGEARRAKAGAASRPRPLDAATFYQRHRRRAALTVGATALMVLGVALLVFIMMAVFDVTKPGGANLKSMSLVASNGAGLDPGLVERIRSYPATEKVIPAYSLYPLDIVIPPVSTNYPVETYAVTAGDMAYLVDLYQLKLAEGRLPPAGSNGIVLPWALAKNRNLAVGDVLGDGNHPVYTGAPVLPAKLAVSGIFAPASDPNEETWLSFMSLEFIEPSRNDWKTGLSLIVTSRPGQKAALDAWLESEIGGEGISVRTYGKYQAFLRGINATGLATVSLMESIIALVAALALAGLNYIFITQRQAEFALLNALGFSRLQLVRRVVRETLLTAGTAWLLGALGCAVIVVYMYFGVYDPVGFRLNFFNPTPWLFTLPIPVAVLAVSAVTMTWMFSRLDPVAIIERRA